MSAAKAEQALINHVVTMASVAEVVVPQGEMKGLPRYVIRAAGAGTRTFDLSGTTEADVEIVVSVETDTGQYVTESNTLSDELETRFRPGTRITHGGVTVTVLRPPETRPPIVGDGVYSVPVIIRGRVYY